MEHYATIEVIYYVSYCIMIVIGYVSKRSTALKTRNFYLMLRMNFMTVITVIDIVLKLIIKSSKIKLDIAMTIISLDNNQLLSCPRIY